MNREPMRRWSSTGVLVLVVVALLAFPAFVRAFLPPFYVPLASNMLVMGLFALGYDILMGYTGMVSFGHAAFFGLGAYGAGLGMLRFGLPFPVAAVLGVLLAGAAALAIGFFSIRLKSVYFALLTFAFAQIFYQTAVVWQVFTGGADGVAISTSMLVGLPGVLEVNLRDRTTFYYVVLAVVAVVYLAARRIVGSPFGSVLATIRENEVRSETMGYHVSRYKQVAFALSGAIGGIAGALYVPYQQFVSPDLLYWESSGLVIIMVLLGGMRTLWGPLLGGAIVVFLSDWLTAYTKHYMLLLGLIFVLLVMYMPDGIAGAFRGWKWRSRSAEQAPQPTEALTPSTPSLDS